jgi:hypothetical protein
MYLTIPQRHTPDRAGPSRAVRLRLRLRVGARISGSVRRHSESAALRGRAQTVDCTVNFSEPFLALLAADCSLPRVLS